MLLFLVRKDLLTTIFSQDGLTDNERILILSKWKVISNIIIDYIKENSVINVTVNGITGPPIDHGSKETHGIVEQPGTGTIS